MKSIYLGLALMAAAGCSDDSALSLQSVPQNGMLSGRNPQETILPGNASNPYDSAGAVHNLIVLSYYASDWTGNSQSAGKRIDFLAGNSLEFGELDGAPYAVVDSLRIESINSSADPLALVMQDSDMSPAADSSLSFFLYGFFGNYGSADYEQVYDSVAKYEEIVLNDTALALDDRKVILTVTSIMRHAACLEKKKPKKNEDPDWLLLIGSIAAAVDGAQQGTGQAVAMAAASGVLYNFK